MSADQVDALVIFGATGDLAKLETFPALVGLVERGVLDVPVLGVAKSGWGLPQFRDYAAASLKLNNMDPSAPAAVKLLDRLQYVDGDLGDHATYDRLIGAALNGERWLFAQQDTVEASWRVVDPVVGHVGPVVPYARGSWGPDSSSLLPGGATWYNPSA
jgi:glucose-6-phosphate 1-dehydrogenase